VRLDEPKKLTQGPEMEEFRERNCVIMAADQNAEGLTLHGSTEHAFIALRATGKPYARRMDEALEISELGAPCKID
jgi:hypothetical protein